MSDHSSIIQSPSGSFLDEKWLDAESSKIMYI